MSSRSRLSLCSYLLKKGFSMRKASLNVEYITPQAGSKGHQTWLPNKLAYLVCTTGMGVCVGATRALACVAARCVLRGGVEANKHTDESIMATG